MENVSVIRAASASIKKDQGEVHLLALVKAAKINEDQNKPSGQYAFLSKKA